MKTTVEIAEACGQIVAFTIESERAKNLAYSERNKLVALLARMALARGLKVGVGQHPAEDTEWEACR